MWSIITYFNWSTKFFQVSKTDSCTIILQFENKIWYVWFKNSIFYFVLLLPIYIKLMMLNITAPVWIPWLIGNILIKLLIKFCFRTFRMIIYVLTRFCVGILMLQAIADVDNLVCIYIFFKLSLFFIMYNFFL